MQPQSTADVGTPLAPLPPFTVVRKGSSPKKFAYARRMRAKPTLAEARLWWAIHLGIAGFTFRQQSVVRGWIPDFYCPAAGLIIEVDGGIHRQRRAYDQHRTDVLRAMGLHVIRFSNEEVLADVEAVCGKIRDILRAGGLAEPSYTPRTGGRVARQREFAQLAEDAEPWPEGSPFA